MRLQDMTAVVTGGDTGIGRAISLAMVRDGARVVIDYEGDETAAMALVAQIEHEGGTATAIRANVAQPTHVAELIAHAVETFGGIDIMVNNAGTVEQHPFLDMPLETWTKVIAVDLTAVWLCSQGAARQMVSQGRGGRIINISSVHEDLAMPTNAPYCAAKGGVRMLMRTLAVELAPHAITVNNICPGAIDTTMHAGPKTDDDEFEILLDEIPLHRMGTPEEVADLCMYLASPAASYVTGASYLIDGGMSKTSSSL